MAQGWIQNGSKKLSVGVSGGCNIWMSYCLTKMHSSKQITSKQFYSSVTETTQIS